MTEVSPSAPIIVHAKDVLRRARKMLAGSTKNDLRQLARGLIKMQRAGIRRQVQFSYQKPNSENAMEHRIRLRHRSPFPRPWKWEICVGDHLVTASHESYGSREEAYRFAQPVLDRLDTEVQRTAKSYEIHDGRLIPKAEK